MTLQNLKSSELSVSYSAEYHKMLGID